MDEPYSTMGTDAVGSTDGRTKVTERRRRDGYLSLLLVIPLHLQHFAMEVLARIRDCRPCLGSCDRLGRPVFGPIAVYCPLGYSHSIGRLDLVRRGQGEHSALKNPCSRGRRMKRSSVVCI